MLVRVGPSVTRTIRNLSNMSPTTQRLIIGGTGLLSQTTIDAMNPFVDEDTRKYAAVRTAIRMVVCTTSGVLTREIGQKLGEWAVKTGKLAAPKGVSNLAFASAVGRVFAVVGAIFSIFLIDVPFINSILNFAMDKIFGAKKTTEEPANKEKKVNIFA